MSDYGTTPPPPPPGSGDGGYDGGYAAPPPMGGPSGSPPPNNLILAIVSLLCCWPVGIPAIIFAAQVNSKWAQGDQAGAVEASAKAKKFAIIAFVLGIISSVIYGIVVVAGGMAASSGGM